MNVCLHLNSNAVNLVSQQPDGPCEHAHHQDQNTSTNRTGQYLLKQFWYTNSAKKYLNFAIHYFYDVVLVIVDVSIFWRV